jgi:hypothetical protein
MKARYRWPLQKSLLDRLVASTHPNVPWDDGAIANNDLGTGGSVEKLGDVGKRQEAQSTGCRGGNESMLAGRI